MHLHTADTSLMVWTEQYNYLSMEIVRTTLLSLETYLFRMRPGQSAEVQAKFFTISIVQGSFDKNLVLSEIHNMTFDIPIHTCNCHISVLEF